MIKSPLRYPGGKTRAIKKIAPLIPNHTEYRDPFVGGGSVYAHIKQSFSAKTHWINDLNFDLYLFWKYARDNNPEIVKEVKRIKQEWKDGRALFEHYKDNLDKLSEFDRAVRFFVLNRITFSGTIDSGGYSKQSFNKRFTYSSIVRLANLEKLLQDTTITNLDYEEVVTIPGNDVVIFLDPPYCSTTASRLYGKKGDLHVSFDHERFANVMKDCQHKWLITYDDCEKIRKNFSFANIKSYGFQYGMNSKKGKEIFIYNY